MNQVKFWQTKKCKKIKNKSNCFAVKAFCFLENEKVKTILDLGCGRSQDSFYFAKKGFFVTALDISQARLKVLKTEADKQNLSINFKLADIKHLNFENNSFDIIYAHLSLHYFNTKNTKQIIAKLYKILKKNGYLFIKVKSIEDPTFGLGKKLENNIFNYKGHLKHFFDKKELLDFLFQFKIIKIRKTTSKYLEHSYKSNYIEVIAQKD